MVDFGNSVFEGKLEASTPLLNPVSDRSAETFAGGLSDSIDRFNKMVFDPSKKAAQADADKNGLFADYAEKVGLIADAKDQGKFGTDEAMRNIRVAQNQFLSNHPELTDDFFTFSNKLMTENGFGGSIVKESPAEAGNRKKLEGYAQDGWDITNPESLAAAEKFSQDKIYLQGVANEIDKIEASGKIASASIKAQAIGGLHSVVANGIPWVNDQINKAYTQLQGVTDPVQRQAIIDQTKAKVAQQTAIIQSLRSQTGDEASGYLLTGIEGLMTNFDAVASGKSNLEAVQNANTMIDASYQHLIMTSDPELAALIVMDKTSPFKNPEAYNRLDQKRIELAAKLGIKNTTDENGQVTSEAKPPDIVDKSENVAVVFDDLKQTTGNIVRAGSAASPEVIGEQANKIVNVLRSTAKYGANDSDARNFTAVVDFLADPTVGKFIEQNGTIINPQIAGTAKQVTEQQYGEVVLNLINERWATAGEAVLTGVGGQTADVSVSDVVEPIWNGAGVEFVAKEGYKDDFRINTIVQDLNKGSNSIAGPLNKLIRMSAHLSGNTDYEKVYNESYKSRLETDAGKQKPSMGQMTGKDLSANSKQMKDTPMSTDNPSDLNLADFSDEELKKIVNESGAKNPEGMIAAGSPLEIAQSYLGKTEAKGEDVKTLSAFIGRATGQNINPATTAWCAAFMNAVLNTGGSKGTGKLNARSYLTWGVPVTDPKVGDVVVLQRSDGGKNDWQGHVGFYMGTNADGTIKVLGGNQGDSVSEDDFDANRVLGFRRAG